VALVAIFFAVLCLAGPDFRSGALVYEPPWLLFTLNFVFITGLCLVVAVLSLQIYLRGGFPGVLLLGGGVLAFGLSSFTAGWLIRPPYGPNATLTIHNAGILFTSVCFFLSSLSAALGVGFETDTRRRAPAAGTAYLGVCLLGGLLTGAVMLGWTPSFFIAGEGPTVLRQIVLAISVTLLASAAVLLRAVFPDRSSGFLLYSLVAILLIGIGLVGVAMGAAGSPLSWLGRSSQYLGIAYLAIAVMGARSEAKVKGTTVEKALADYFSRSEILCRTLIEMAADAVVTIDREGAILLVNPAAECVFRVSRHEVVGRRMVDLFLTGPSRDVFLRCLSDETCRDAELKMTRKDGVLFPAEISSLPERRTGTEPRERLSSETSRRAKRRRRRSGRANCDRGRWPRPPSRESP
jgi:PAS domain S-box-containing protein